MLNIVEPDEQPCFCHCELNADLSLTLRMTMMEVNNSIIPHTMKAVVVESSTGGVDALVFKSNYPIPCLVVPAGHALMKNEFAGLNFIDTYHYSGLYP